MIPIARPPSVLLTAPGKGLDRLHTDVTRTKIASTFAPLPTANARV